MERRMDGAKFRDILEKNLKRSAKRLKMGWKFILQQDNDPKHKAKAAMEWLAKNKVDVLEWLSQSLDVYLYISISVE